MSVSLFLRANYAAGAACLALTLGACTEESAPEEPINITATDPLIARALSDPLMVDPDLAYRNEANAAVTVRYDHPLPPIAVSEEQAGRARDAVLAQLLEDGPIPDLPARTSGQASDSLSNARYAAQMIEAAGGPTDCADRLEEGLNWSIDMPAGAELMPHGMVQQAAGAESGECKLRVVRYFAPVSVEEALQYHFTIADRASLSVTRYSSPADILVGEGRTAQLVVQVGEGTGGLSTVDLVYWAK